MRKGYVALGVMLTALSLGACQKKTDQKNTTASTQAQDTSKQEVEAKKFEYPHIEAKNYPKVDGSTATLPLAQAIYELTTGSSPEDAARNIVHNKTTESYFNLMDKSTDLIISYAPPSDLMKTIEAVNQSGKNQTYTNNRRRDYEVSPILIAPVGKDALVFLNSQKNKVKNVTEQQLQDIYSGKIKNWKELGGEDHVIKAFQRPKNSGSQNLMEKFVMKDVEMTRPPSEWVASEMGELIEKVAAYDNSADAMGYSVYYYARNMKKGDGLQFLQVNGVEPNSDTIRSGDYPYTNPFYIAIRADEPKDSPAYQIYQWVLSMNGQALVNELGYVANEKSDVKISSEDLKKIGLEEKNDTVSGKYFPDHTLLALPGSTYG
ncbi:MAG: substrate-binding domain-containing protein, partial [Lachnospiraceae bacterium]|nr:substrate-binding domain-containing protein [Lachnospiraceae bacterium]